MLFSFWFELDLNLVTRVGFMLFLKGNQIRCGVVLLLLGVIFLSIPYAAMAAQISLSWDKNKETTIIGYRVYGRLAHQDYDYDKPFWFGSENSCVIRNLEDNENYYFVVRAFTITGSESDDSDEVEYDYENDYGSEAGMETDINVDYGLDGNGLSAITDSGKGLEAGSGCFIHSIFTAS
ncbi:MAG: fibronectin type III domain-containing protein [Desulfobacteraceae bacterium]|nr:MAG: fibronectin type III domain-containing protein [Desulfobacteraceae bacterium]